MIKNRMSAQVLFNQFAYSDRLKAGGFSDEQARASVDALASALSETVATSHQLDAVEQRLDAKIEKLDAKIDAVEQKFDAKIEKLNTKIDAVEQRLDAKIDARVDGLEQKLTALHADIGKQIAEANANQIKWFITAAIAISGAVWTIVKFVH